MTVAIVIGTGRSGTSLAMQALDALGFPVVGDAVPAGENNLRGTGEAVELRDAMFRLHRSLGGPRGFLPDGWQNTSVACDTREWLTRYLSVGAADEGQPNLALKFPLSSLFLPLLRDAVREAAVEPVWIWATRPPAEVIASLMRAYHSTVENATATWVQRTFYLLRDSPDDTHLLPFGTWRENSDAQVAYLAGTLGCEDGERIAAAKACFSARLDHAQSDPPPLSDQAAAALERVSSMLDGKKGRLADLVSRDSDQFCDALMMLGTALNKLVPPSSITDDEAALRLAMLERLSQDPAEEAKMKDELEVLASRIREVAAENAKLLRQSSTDSGNVKNNTKSDGNSTGATVKDGARMREVEISRLSEENRTLRNELAKVRAAGEEQAELFKTERKQFEALRLSYQTLAQARDDAEESAETHHRAKLGAAEMRASILERRALRHEAQNEKLQQRLNAMSSEADSSAIASLREENLELSVRYKEAHQKLARTAAKLAESEAEKKRMRRSKSWRVTAPLRKLRQLFP